MKWMKFDDPVPPFGISLLAHALDEGSPVYLVSRHDDQRPHRGGHRLAAEPGERVMKWMKFDDQMPPFGLFLLARALDEDSPVYAVARHVGTEENSYIRFCTPNGWQMLPEGDYATCAWCTIEEPKLLRRYRAPHWIEDRPHHWRCSVCGAMWGDAHVMMHFCPGCGARMYR